jgi:hypothetical protein
LTTRCAKVGHGKGAWRLQVISIFPTTILLATDGSTGAELAAETASELAKRTGSELHVLYVLALPIDTHDPSSFEPEVRRLD